MYAPGNHKPWGDRAGTASVPAEACTGWNASESIPRFALYHDAQSLQRFFIMTTFILNLFLVPWSQTNKCSLGQTQEKSKGKIPSVMSTSNDKTSG